MTKLTSKWLLMLTLTWLMASSLQKIVPVNQQSIIAKDVEGFVAEQLGIEKKHLANGIVDSNGRYGVAGVRKLEEVFLVVWDMETGEIIYTTRGKNRYPTAYTWVGEKLVYIAYDDVSYTYQLEPDYMSKHRITAKVFCFDLATQKELVLNLQVGYPEIVYSCGNELILFEIIGLRPNHTSRMIWYNVAQDKRIQEWVVNVEQYFGTQDHDASLVYCTPDHKRAWVVTILDGPRLPYTGYAPAPVPVLGVIEREKVRFLMNAEKEWLYRLYGSPVNYLIRVIRTGQEEVIAAVTFNQISNLFYLIHFSSKGEIYRKKLDKDQLVAKGIKEFSFLYIDKTGKRLLCQEQREEKRVFWWDVESNRIEIIAKGLSKLEITRLTRKGKILVWEDNSKRLLDIGIE